MLDRRGDAAILNTFDKGADDPRHFANIVAERTPLEPGIGADKHIRHRRQEDVDAEISRGHGRGV